MFNENLPKRGPCLDNLDRKPTHMGGTFPYPQHFILPPEGNGHFAMGNRRETEISISLLGKC